MQRVISSRYIYLIAALLSVILSYCLHSRSMLLNRDAICYLQSAEMVNQGLSAVMSLCDQSKWPFYPLLIAGFVKLFHVSYQLAAFVINDLFSLLSVLVFMRIVAFFTDKKSILCFAALTILCAHEFNALRVDIIRDHGFWFFYLASILFLLQYFQSKQWLHVFAWSASLILATLFRIEGIIFFVLMPGVVWLNNQYSYPDRLRIFAKLVTPLMVGACGVLLVMLMHPSASLGRLNEFYAHLQWSHFYSGIIQHYQSLADALGVHVLGRSEGDRYTIYFFTLVVWYVAIIISALSLLYAILFGYGIIKKSLTLNKSASLVLCGYIFINVAMTFLFLIENQFVSKRYVIALALTLMIWVPFALESLMQRWRQRKWLFSLLLVLIVLNGVSVLFHLGHSKQYIREAGDWLNQHAAQTAKIYSNDYQVLYYSQHFANQIFEKQREYADLSRLHDDWQQFDYIAIRLDQETLTTEATLLNAMKIWPYITFKGQHGEDQIRIYQRNR